MKQALAQQKPAAQSPAEAEAALQRAELPLALAQPNSKRSLVDAGQLHSRAAAKLLVEENDRRERSVAAGQRTRQMEEKEAPLALAAPSHRALVDAGQLNMPAAAAALRKLRLARLKMQAEQHSQGALIGRAAAAQLASPDSTPPLLRAAEQDRRRALANAQIVVPAARLRAGEQWADSSLFKPSDASAYMRRTGLRHRLADVQRNQDNGGFFESPASVVEE